MVEFAGDTSDETDPIEDLVAADDVEESEEPEQDDLVEDEGGMPATGAASARSGRVALGGDRRGKSHLSVTAFDEHGRPSVLEHTFVVEAECHGWRLDRFLMKRMPRVSRARIQRAIRGDLDVNGARVERPGFRVQAGHEVSFRRPAPVEPDVPRTVRVLVADEAFYAIDKPAGLPIHPTAKYHYGTLTAVLRETFPGERLEVCHRIDRETSGLLLVARNREGLHAGAAIKRAFARRHVEKVYFAIVHGELDEEREIDEPLGLGGSRVRLRMAVRPVEEGGLPSRTRVVPVSRFEGYTLLACHPLTGRQHQIRAHLDHAGFPIVGDKLYPDEDRFIRFTDDGPSEDLMRELELPRHALHAHALVFPHPVTGERVRVECPLPPDLAGFLSRLTPR